MGDDFDLLRSDSSDNDDMFGGFSDPTDSDFDANSGGDSTPDWLQELAPAEEEPEPIAAPAAVSKSKSESKKKPARSRSKKRRKSSPDGMMFGMTPVQRMALSIFLFLDVSVLGLAILFALEVIGV